MPSNKIEVNSDMSNGRQQNQATKWQNPENFMAD